jgi:hypothetical protein
VAVLALPVAASSSTESTTRRERKQETLSGQRGLGRAMRTTAKTAMALVRMNQRAGTAESRATRRAEATAFERMGQVQTTRRLQTHRQRLLVLERGSGH